MTFAVCDSSYVVEEGWTLFHSRTAEAKYGSATYENEAGAWVQATFITKDPTGAAYKYEDKVCLGRAVRYIGAGRKGDFFNPEKLLNDPDW